MSRIILKIEDCKLQKFWYLEWSTVVDAPVTRGMSLEEIKKYLYRKYSKISKTDINAAIERVEQTGTSSSLNTDGIQSYLNGNRAGENEITLSFFREKTHGYADGMNHGQGLLGWRFLILNVFCKRLNCNSSTTSNKI